MKAGYRVEHCGEKDCLGSTYTISEQIYMSDTNTIWIFYWTEIQYCGSPSTTAIFRLYPGRTNPRRWMRDNLKTTDNEY